MKYKLLIFDADETLFDFSLAEKYAFKKAMEEGNLIYKESHLALYKEINITIWKEFERGEITQKELKIDRFRRFLDGINKDLDPIVFAESFMNNLADASFLFEGAIDLIKKLSKTHRLVMVTNGLTRVQKHRVRESVIAKYFEEIIISEEIGYAKPDPTIFVEGMKNLSLPEKSEMLIIGDSLTSDIPGGINYGIDTCWYNPMKKVNTSEYKPTYTIFSLKELHDIK